jgi:hypothetical protein
MRLWISQKWHLIGYLDSVTNMVKKREVRSTNIHNKTCYQPRFEDSTASEIWYNLAILFSFNYSGVETSELPVTCKMRCCSVFVTIAWAIATMSSRRLIACLLARLLAWLFWTLLRHTRKHVTIGKHVTFGSCRHISWIF